MFSFTKEELQERERQLSETSHTLEQTQSSLKFTKQVRREGEVTLCIITFVVEFSCREERKR